MFNPNEEKQMSRLRDAITDSRMKLRPFRKNRLDFIKQYVGNHYSDNGSTDRVPVNFLAMAVLIYMRQLAARTPQVIINPVNGASKDTWWRAKDYEAAMNKWLLKNKFGNNLQKVVLDAMFSIGIIKKGTAIDGDSTVPFADAIHLDNWVHDMTAKSMSEMKFMGDIYRLDYEYVMESGEFNKKTIDGLKPSDYKNTTNEGEEKVSAISQGESTFKDSLVDFVEVMDVWLPEGMLITMLVDGDKKPLKVVEWDGPPTGPYGILSFGDVPDNVMPLSPVSLWTDLHDLANRLFDKIGRQAERQKTILGIQCGNNEDAETITNSRDGQAVRLNNPSAAQELNFGGVDAKSLAFLLQTKDLFSYFSGNLDSIGGLDTTADTVGGEQLVNASSSKVAMDLQDRTVTFSQETLNDIGYYLFTEPLVDIQTTRKIPGIDKEFPVSFNRNTRSGSFFDYDISIQLYSMQHQSPGSQLNTLCKALDKYIIPLAPLIQQQGKTLNIDRLVDIIGRLANIPELSEIITAGPTVNPQMQQNGGGMPNNTTRTYERVNKPGATTQGKDAATMQLLLGGQPQEAEMAALSRSAG